MKTNLKAIWPMVALAVFSDWPFLSSKICRRCKKVVEDSKDAASRSRPRRSKVTVTEIPGVIAAGAQWKLVWQGPDNADGLVGMKDGSILFAQEQPSTVRRIDEHDKVTLWASDTHGTGALGIDRKGRVLGVERTCSDPGGHPDQCHENAEVIVITPHGHTTLAKEYNGKPFWRMGELVCDSKGGVYFNDDNGTYFVDAKGKVSLVADKSVRTNGMMLSRDEKTLVVTNGKTLVAWDINPDGTTTNQHNFGALHAQRAMATAWPSTTQVATTSLPATPVFRCSIRTARTSARFLCQGLPRASLSPAPARKSSTARAQA